MLYLVRLFLFVNFSGSLLLAQDTLTYFNDRWEEICCSDSAMYYRIGKNNFGVYEGQVKDYYSTGELQMEGQYVSSTPHGTFKYYYKNGQLAYIENHETGRVNAGWDMNGKKIIREGNGEFTHLNNLQIEFKGKYLNGRSVGYWYFNNSSEVKIKEMWFNQDGSLYKMNCWDDNGDSLQIQNGTGTLISYYKNGKLKHFIEMKNHHYHGVYKSYYSNGMLKENVFYEDGYPVGEVTSFYNNGQMRQYYFVVDKRIHGESTLWFSNGKIQANGFYLMGAPSGRWVYYDELGVEINDAHFNPMNRGERRRQFKPIPLMPIKFF